MSMKCQNETLKSDKFGIKVYVYNEEEKNTYNFLFETCNQILDPTFRIQES